MNPPIEKVIEVVRNAGEDLVPHFGNIKASRYKTDNPSDSVTELDIKTEESIRRGLTKLDSSIGFKGEELGESGSSERFWLMDPIDGTEFFIRGVWGCTNMLALIENGEIVLSVIYDFIRDEVFYAEKGNGAFCNKKSIKVSDRRLNQALIYVEINLEVNDNLSKYLRLDKVCIPLRGYPSGIHFTLAAAGKVEGRIGLDPWGKDYDFAPGQLLVKEAGGVIKNIGKNSFDYSNLNYLAVNPKVYNELTTGPNAIFSTSN